MKSNQPSFAILFVMISILIGNICCKKFIEIETPITSTNAGVVYGSDANASAVLTGIYYRISSSTLTSSNGILTLSSLPGLSADELTLFNIAQTEFNAYYTNSLSSMIGTNADFWVQIYPLIFVANSAIEGVSSSNLLSISIKKQLVGEAKFLRAFFYFYLVNLYGDVPLVLTTDYKLNSLMPRTPKAMVWQQIINDLEDSQELMSESYLAADIKSTTTDKVRPTKWAATAMLARSYLYMGEFAKAEFEASHIINSGKFKLVPLNSVFKMNSLEAIWQIQPNGTGTLANTREGALFVLKGSVRGPNTSSNSVYLSNNIVYSFEFGDQRAVIGNWVDTVKTGTNIYYYPYKYKIGISSAPVQEYSMVLRLGELYLIRAEARAFQGNIGGAKADLDSIRSRAGLGPTLVTSQEAMMSAILQERKVELFTEWGHRWLDLKRTGKIDSVMSLVAAAKGTNWNSIQQFYPIVLSELQSNPQIIQNEGY